MSSKPSPCDAEAVAEALDASGAAVWGIAEAGEVEAAEMERFDSFIAEGRHASMDYLARYREIRLNPLRLLEGEPRQGAVIVCAFPYAAEYDPEPGADRIARYALGDDYHETLRKRLRPAAAILRSAGFQARVCVDSAPILERYWAVRAGLGTIGLNRQLAVPGLGSYIFLAEIVTDAPHTSLLLPDAIYRVPTPNSRPMSVYGRGVPRIISTKRRPTAAGPGCGACAAACPTGALAPDGAFDARLCVNYLTIEHRGPLPATLNARGREIPTGEILRGVLYGCDRCQEACPLNCGTEAAPLPEFLPRPALLSITRAKLEALTPEDRAELLRRSPLRRGLNRR